MIGYDKVLLNCYLVGWGRIAEHSSVLQPSSSYTGLFSQDGCTPVRWGRMDEQSSIGRGRMYDRVR